VNGTEENNRAQTHVKTKCKMTEIATKKRGPKEDRVLRKKKNKKGKKETHGPKGRVIRIRHTCKRVKH